MTEPAPRRSIDRVILGGVWVALCVTVGNVVVGAIMAYTDANNSVGQDVGMLIVILFFLGLLASGLLHLALLAASVVRGAQGGARSMRWVYIFLGVSMLGHATAAMLLLA